MLSVDAPRPSMNRLRIYNGILGKLWCKPLESICNVNSTRYYKNREVAPWLYNASLQEKRHLRIHAN